MEAQRETVGLNPGILRRGSDMDPREDVPTLAEAGIDKHLCGKEIHESRIIRDAAEGLR